MPTAGVTRTCTIRSILDTIDRAGGSITRVFRRAGVSPRLVEDSERLILLKEQFALLDATAHEIGDSAAAARMSIEAGIDGLGSYGRAIVAEPTLGDALRLARDLLPSAMQTATRVELSVECGRARWSYVVDDPSTLGRQHNELLCAGYVLAVLRRFGGPRWTPSHVAIAGPAIEGRRAIEGVLACSLSSGATTSFSFPADMLDCRNLLPRDPPSLARLPDPGDTAALITEMIASAIPGGRPTLVDTAARVGVAPRSLQRRLTASGTTFERLLDHALADRGKALLAQGRPATEVAYELGFADPSHFTRAFRRWTGETPRTWRRITS